MNLSGVNYKIIHDVECTSRRSVCTLDKSVKKVGLVVNEEELLKTGEFKGNVCWDDFWDDWRYMIGDICTIIVIFTD